jgi:hypothetical protein
MTKDMFDLSSTVKSGGKDKIELAKNIFDSIFEGENIFENSNFDEILPKVAFYKEEGGVFVLQTICVFKSVSSKFIHDLIYSEVDSVSYLEVESFCSLPFRFFELDVKKYLVTEVSIVVTDQEKIENSYHLIKNLQKQMRLGLRSEFYARMVMEMKVSSPNGKLSYIQERIIHYIQRFPKVFDYDLIPFTKEFMVEASETFIKDRSVKDLSKIIATLYFCKKRNVPLKARAIHFRQIHVKTYFIHREELFRRKKVLAVIISLSCLLDNERLEQDHILKACRRFILKANSIEESFIKLSIDSDKNRVFYLEIEKKDGSITCLEKKTLHEGLLKHLEEDIQKFARKIFMPQNTEEIMKYTVALSKELKTKEDYPQVAILFDSQSNDNLIFTAIIVRVKKDQNEAFKIFESSLEKKYTCSIKHLRSLGEFKEGLEVTYKMKIRYFMRDDYSIDIYRARAGVIKDLEKRFGIIRDYNGGMLEKQGGLLLEAETILKKKGVKNVVLIENFFYAIQPPEICAILDVDSFVNFFLFFFSLFSFQTASDSKLEIKDGEIYFIARVKSEKKKEAFINEVKQTQASFGDLVYFSLKIQEKFYLGVKFKYGDENSKINFLDKMSICLKL